MKSKCRCRCIALVLASISFLGGCMKKQDDHANETKRDNLKLCFSESDIFSFDPHDLVLDLPKQALAKLLFEGLTRFNDQGAVELAGAKKIDISANGKEYRIKVRPHCYADGTWVTAHDYVSSWQHVLAPQSRYHRVELLYCIKNAKKAKQGICSIEDVGIQALDTDTILVNLDHPAPYFLELLSLPIFFPSKKKEGQPLTNGPFMVETFQKGYRLTLKRNPYFWAKDCLHVKTIEISMLKDDMTALRMYEKGELDFVGNTLSALPMDVLPALKNREDYHRLPVLRPYWVFLNPHCFTPFTSLSIRRALSQAIDRTQINAHILIDSEQLDRVLPTSVSHYQPHHFSQTPVAEFEKGLEELGITREDFPPLILTSCCAESNKRVSEYLQQKWESTFGIKVVLKICEWQDFFDRMRAGKCPVGGCFTSFNYNDPLAPLEQFASPGFHKWANPLFKKTVTAIKETQGEERSQFIRKAEQLLEEEAIILPIANQCIFYLCNPSLKGIIFNQSGVMDLSRAYFE